METNQQLKRVLGPTENCPPLERLLSGKLNVKEQSHASECRHCAAEVALYQSFEEAAPRPDEAASVQWIAGRLQSTPLSSERRQPGVPREAWWKRVFSIPTLVPASLALASVLAVIGIVQVSHRSEQPDGVHVTAADTMRSQSLDVTAPLGEIARIPKTLNWAPVTGAATYSVRVMEVDRNVLWHGNLSGNAVALPTDVLSIIVPHKRILWDVTALDNKGRTLASSGSKDFVLIPLK